MTPETPKTPWGVHACAWLKGSIQGLGPTLGSDYPAPSVMDRHFLPHWPGDAEKGKQRRKRLAASTSRPLQLRLLSHLRSLNANLPGVPWEAGLALK